ncbi:putative enzyme related to lactoylglutathione lyase [Pseudorhizobium tarimense]|uniref:Enzyme related to lactoylglutathione lyase n=1 Tax=Pseudorhizobium tarimense TaxID=1079109 RepID=A0ABV2H349_9HYPH|nr:VOC family protein [Pseudorhizobium tarimense]MCJ8518047.1 VOC family protein [Pseudorhizobium tarimense]
MAAEGADQKIDYIEFDVKDIERAKQFYGNVFGWNFTDYGPDYCGFGDGRLTGGFAKADSVTPKGGALVIVYASDLEAAQARVEKAGGQVSRPIFDFPGGRRFHFVDPDGYELGSGRTREKAALGARPSTS